MKINLERLESLLNQIKESHAFLARYRNRPPQKLAQETDVVAAIKYQLIVAVQASIDLCNHLSAKLFTQAPTDYADCFRILAKNQVLSDKLVEKMVRWARLRNLLVHLYGEVDNQRLLLETLADLDDLLEYAAAIHSYVQERLRSEG